MWIIIFLALVSTLILFNIIRVMIYGKSIYRPNFRRVDEILSAKTGFKSSWNTWYGKTIYYFSIIGVIVFLIIILYTFFS